MIVSGNMPLPCEMTVGHTGRSIDDPRWSLSALTGEPRGSEQAAPAVTRGSAPVSAAWDAVEGFSGRP